MKSKTFSYNLVMENWKKHIGYFAFSCLMMFVFYTLVSVMKISSIMADGEIKVSQRSAAFLSYCIGDATRGGTLLKTVLVVALILGAIGAVSMLGYLHSRKKVDFYHSLPVTRENLFTSNLLGSILSYIISVTGCAVIVIGATVLNGLYTMQLLGVMWIIALLGLLFYLLGYVLGALAMLLTGRIFMGVLGICVFLLYVPAWEMIAESMAGWCFHTYSSLTSVAGTFQWWDYLSPFELVDQIGNYNMTGYSMLQITVIILLVAALMVLDYFLYHRRPSEAARQSMAFGRIASVIKVMLVIPMALAGGLFFQGVGSGSETLWFLFGLVFTFLVGCALIQMLYEMDVRRAFGGKKSLLISAVGVVLIVCIYKFDLAGYDTYMPAQNKIANLNFDIKSGYLTNAYYERDSYQLFAADMGNEDSLYQFMEKVVQNAHEISKEEADEADYSVTAVYDLNNGKKISRVYRVNYERIREEIRQVMNASPQLLDHMYPLRTIKPDTVKTVSLEKPSYMEEAQSFHAEDGSLKRFVQALQQDMQEMDAATLMDETPIGRILLERQKSETEIEAEKYAATAGSFMVVTGSDQNIVYEYYYIYPSFAHTLTCLKEAGVDLKNSLDMSQITGLNIFYNANSDSTAIINGSGTWTGIEVTTADIEYLESGWELTETFTGNEQAQELLPYLTEMDYTRLDDDFDRNYVIELMIRDAFGDEVAQSYTITKEAAQKISSLTE